jgi:hypothetical protein
MCRIRGDEAEFMRWGLGKVLGEGLEWLLVTTLPVALAVGYNEVASFLHNGDLPPDPRDWNWAGWALQLGPLLGFGFLAGATMHVPDPIFECRWPRQWVRKRAIWVAVGPWLGLVIAAAVFLTLRAIEALMEWLRSATPQPEPPSSAPAPSWTREVLLAVAMGAFLGYLWLIPAVAAIRRAKRIGLAWDSFKRGAVLASAFIASLFGGFWAATEAWRTFFFDTRVFPVVLAGSSLALLAGCGTPTYGEVRRRELFHVMLLSWTFGLALIWRWYSRQRRST